MKCIIITQTGQILSRSLIASILRKLKFALTATPFNVQDFSKTCPEFLKHVGIDSIQELHV